MDSILLKVRFRWCKRCRSYISNPTCKTENEPRNKSDFTKIETTLKVKYLYFHKLLNQFITYRKSPAGLFLNKYGCFSGIIYSFDSVSNDASACTNDAPNCNNISTHFNPSKKYRETVPIKILTMDYKKSNLDSWQASRNSRLQILWFFRFGPSSNSVRQFNKKVSEFSEFGQCGISRNINHWGLPYSTDFAKIRRPSIHK